MVARKGQCQYRQPGNGVQCKAHARTNDRFCFFHSPQTAKARKRAQKAGGFARSRRATPPTALSVREKQLRTAPEVCQFLSETIHQVRAGVLDPRVANAVGYLVNIHLRALEQAGSQSNGLLVQGGTMREVYKAKWLRDKEAALAREFEAEANSPEQLT
jgi:hypothetical protein